MTIRAIKAGLRCCPELCPRFLSLFHTSCAHLCCTGSESQFPASQSTTREELSGAAPPRSPEVLVQAQPGASGLQFIYLGTGDQTQGLPELSIGSTTKPHLQPSRLSKASRCLSQTARMES